MGTSTTQPAPDSKASPCIARQPILNADECVIGYELLFREDPAQDHFSSDGENATRTLIDTLSVLGLEVLCDGRIAFINCTQQMLVNDYFLLLPSDEVVIEIQENVPADRDTIGACQRLQSAGYKIALDNFVPGDARDDLIPYANFIKVDTRAISQENSASLAAHHGGKLHQMLAHKVESLSDFVAARRNGFTLFQGYFFRHPERMRARHIPASETNCLMLLQAVSKPEIDFKEIEDLIKVEPNLCYRLLHYLNSPLLGIASPVQSVHHALHLLGERELLRWIRMATTLVMGRDRPSDLVLASLVRARFCELIAPKVQHGDTDLFLLGMLSLMDAILEVPIGMVVEALLLDPEITAQLLCGKTREKTTLSPVYDLMVAREMGDWGKVNELGKQLNLSLYFMDKIYNEAMRWAHEITRASRPQ